jgi:hypothetical protein
MGKKKKKKKRAKKEEKRRGGGALKNKMKQLLQWAFHFSKCMPDNLQRTNSS